MAAADILIGLYGATARVTGESEAGEEFVDAWILGVLSVQDYGRVTITAEVALELARAARECDLRVASSSSGLEWDGPS
jgi:hypothetical protein